MKKLACVCLAALLAAGIAGCAPKAEGAYAFDEVLADSFAGLGVEWDAYEHPDVVSEDKWQLVLERVDKLSPAYIRCMINLDWVVTDWQKNTDDGGADDTWSYNWEQSNIKSLLKILDHCQERGIGVALGAWRAVDGWDMRDSSDARYAKIVGDVFDELVNKRGYSCIRWLVPTNEPNYIEGNTFGSWSAGVNNVYAQLQEHGLAEKVAITGPDVSSYTAAMTWCADAARDVGDKLGNYSVHLYVSDYTVDSGNLAENISDIDGAIAEYDDALAQKGLYIWEGGLIDGRNEQFDTNELIDTYGYGFRMADYTVQCILGGAEGVCFWELDDAMHFLENGQTKNWGMFSSLGDAAQQELRPWFQSSMLLTKIFAPGRRVYGCPVNGEKETTVRAAAAVSEDGTEGGYCVMNQGTQERECTFYLPAVSGGEKLYVYIYGEGHTKLGADGYILPNYELDGSLSSALTLRVPAKSTVFVTNVKY